MENFNIAAAAPKELTAYLTELLHRCGSTGCGRVMGEVVVTTTPDVAGTAGTSTRGPATTDSTGSTKSDENTSFFIIIGK